MGCYHVFDLKPLFDEYTRLTKFFMIPHSHVRPIKNSLKNVQIVSKDVTDTKFISIVFCGSVQFIFLSNMQHANSSKTNTSLCKKTSPSFRVNKYFDESNLWKRPCVFEVINGDVLVSSMSFFIEIKWVAHAQLLTVWKNSVLRLTK